MSASWQHIQRYPESQGEPAHILTEGLYDHEKGRWILRAAGIGGFVRVDSHDAARIRASWDFGSHLMKALDAACDAINHFQTEGVASVGALEDIRRMHRILSSLEGIDEERLRQLGISQE